MQFNSWLISFFNEFLDQHIFSTLEINTSNIKCIRVKKVRLVRLACKSREINCTQDFRQKDHDVHNLTLLLKLI